MNYNTKIRVQCEIYLTTTIKAVNDTPQCNLEFKDTTCYPDNEYPSGARLALLIMTMSQTASVAVSLDVILIAICFFLSALSAEI